MALTRADFLRLLPVAVGNEPYRVEGDDIAATEGPIAWRIRLEERPKRAFGPGGLPVLAVPETLDLGVWDVRLRSARLRGPLPARLPARLGLNARPRPVRQCAPMKISLESAAGRNLFTAYGDGYVDVNGTRHQVNVVVAADAVTPNWFAGTLQALGPEHLAPLVEGRPEIVLLGTGSAFRFPHPSVL